MKKDLNNISLHQKGTVIVLKESVPDLELNSKSLLDSLSYYESENKKNEEALQKAKDSIPVYEANIESGREAFKKFAKFKEWAEEIQNSKIKVILDEIKEECFNRAVADVKYDEGLTVEQNNVQKYRFYQKYMATHPKMAGEINRSIISKNVFEEPIFDNPWK